MKFRKIRKKDNFNTTDYASVIGKNRSFSTAEAHKRLRTNVMFSFPDEAQCRVIGITSAMAHEGKTTTALNLAYDLFQLGKKVLMSDADMRMSNVAQILNINRDPGLSDLLVGAKDDSRYIQMPGELDSLPIITSGNPPPNPSELLASRRMGIMLDTLKQKYDYIIIDLPPVSAVSDALILSKLTDGMIVVVRQDYADKRLLDDAIRQLHFQEARIIGFVMNGARTESKYGRYGHYSKYGYYASQDEV